MAAYDDILRMMTTPAAQEEPAPMPAAVRRRRNPPRPRDPLDDLLGLSPIEPEEPAPVLPPVAEPEPIALPEPEPQEEGFLSKVGYVLDTPGALFRGLLAGKAGSRVSGQELLHNYGLVDRTDNPLFSGAGAAGLASEILLDPLNLLPGFMGIKALSGVGRATSKVTPYLDDAAKLAAKYANEVKGAKELARRSAQNVVEQAAADGVSLVDDVAETVVKKPPKKPVHDLLGDLVDDAGEAVSREELVKRLAQRNDEVGAAARELLENKAARGLGDEAFEIAENAGDRVNRGQEALFSIGGRVEPFAPLPYLGKLGFDLPQKTLIEGAETAQKIQDAWRTFAGAPVIRDVGNLFSKTAGVAGKAGAAIKAAKEDFFRDVAKGEGDAAREAEAMLNELTGLEKAPPPAPIITPPPSAVDHFNTHLDENGNLIDNATGNVIEAAPTRSIFDETEFTGPTLPAPPPSLLDEMTDADRYGNLILKPKPNVAEVTQMPPPPAPALKPFSDEELLERARARGEVPPVETPAAPPAPAAPVNGPTLSPADAPMGAADAARPVFDDFTKLEKGHGVEFRPADAVGGARGLRKALKGKVVNIDDASGMATIETPSGQWMVPIDKAKRRDKFVRKDLANAQKRFENATVPKETRDLAADARKLHLEQTGIPDELLMKGGRVDGEVNLGMEAQSFVKEKRDDLLRGLGIDDVGPKGQAAALPKLLEDLLPKVEAGQAPLPNLKKVEFVGDVAPGDKLKFAGHPWEAKEFTPDGKIRLKDTDLPDITVPEGLVPKDKGTAINRAPEGVIDEFMPPELRGPDPKIAKINKAADVLAATEAKLGVNPAGMVDEAAEGAQAVRPRPGGDAGSVLSGELPARKLGDRNDVRIPDAAANRAPDNLIGKDASLRKGSDDILESGSARVPDDKAQMVAPAPGDGPTIPQNLKALSNVELARLSNDLMKAGRIEDARRVIAETRPDRIAKTQAEIRAAGGRPSDKTREDLRDMMQQDRQYNAEQKVVGQLQPVAEATKAAAKDAAQISKGLAPEVHTRVTNLLEKLDASDAPELMKLAGKIREKYKTMLEVEQKAGLKSAAYKGAIDYTTHVSTEEGRRFFQSLKRYPKKQFAVFQALHEQRLAKGLTPAAESIPNLPKLEKEAAERSIVSKTHGKAPDLQKGKPVPLNVQNVGEKALLDLDDEARQFILREGLKDEFLAFSRSIDNSHPSQIARLPAYRDLTIEELNSVFSKWNGKNPVFNPNPAAQQFAREARHIRAMAGQKMLDRIGENVGKPIDPKIAEGGKAIKLDENGTEVLTQFSDGTVGLTEHNKQRIARGLEPVSYDPQTATAILEMQNKLQNPEEVGPLLQWYDGITRIFKSSITRAFPAFHVRNHISNRVQSWLGGVPTTGEHYKIANQVMAGADVKVKLGDGKTLTRDQLIKEAADARALKGGYFEDLLEGAADTTDGLAERLDSTKGKGWSFDPRDPNNVFVDNRVLKMGEKVGATLAAGPGRVASGATKNLSKIDGKILENTDRLGHYVYMRQQGLSPAAAAQHVDKYLFDYSKQNMNDFEKNVMNRVVFFYGYTRNVLPMVLDTALNDVRKVKRITQLGQQPSKPEHLPEYARQGLGVNTGIDSEGNRTVAYDLGTPIEAAAQPIANPLHFALNSLNPIIKTPLEVASGQDFFLQRPIESNTKAPHYVEDMPDSVKAVLGVSEETGKDGNKRYEMDPYALFALQRSPLSRLSNTASKATDERKSGGEVGLNLLAGQRIVSIDAEEETRRAQKRAITKRKDALRKEGKNKSAEYQQLLKAEKAL